MNDSLASIIGLNIDPTLNLKTRLKIGNDLSRFNGRGRSIKTISTDLLFHGNFGLPVCLCRSGTDKKISKLADLQRADRQDFMIVRLSRRGNK